VRLSDFKDDQHAFQAWTTDLVHILATFSKLAVSVAWQKGPGAQVTPGKVCDAPGQMPAMAGQSTHRLATQVRHVCYMQVLTRLEEQVQQVQHMHSQPFSEGARQVVVSNFISQVQVGAGALKQH
jgi:hypothetical protein